MTPVSKAGFALALALQTLAASEPTSSRARPPIIQAIGPINLTRGIDDAGLRRLIGKGCYLDEGGHLGSRYYTNSKRSLTLRVEFGVDWVVELVELSEGLHMPAQCATQPRLVSKRLAQPLPIAHGIRLAMPVDELVLRLGSPARDITEHDARVLTYEASYETDSRVGLFYEAQYSFKSGRLVSISLYSGE